MASNSSAKSSPRLGPRGLTAVVGTLIVSGLVVLWLHHGHRRVLKLHQHALVERGYAVLTTLEGHLRARKKSGQWQSEHISTVLEEISSSPNIHGLAILNTRGELAAYSGFLPNFVDFAEAPVWLPGMMLLHHPVDFQSRPKSPEMPSSLRLRELRPRHPKNDPRTKHQGHDPRQHRPERHRGRRGPHFDPLGHDQALPEEFRLSVPKDQLVALPPQQFWLICAVDTRSLDRNIVADGRRFIVSVLTVVFLMLALLLAMSLFHRQSALARELALARQQQQRLEEMNRVAAGLAHETKNPLMIIRGLAQSSQRDCEDSEKITQQSAMIIDEVDRLTREINGFLRFAKPKEAALAPVSLKALVSEVKELLHDEASAQGAVLSMDVPEARIHADADQLRQVLMNLLVNALQVGATELHVQWQSDDAGRGRLIIDDDGPGLEPKQFSQVTKAYVSYREGGTGLGLAIVEQIAEAHAWQLRLSPSPKSGLRVVLTGLEKSSESLEES